MNKSMVKYLCALLLFGSNGIIASLISLNSCEIVMFRTLIGSLLLIVLYFITNRHFTFFHHKKDFLFLILSGISMGISWLFLYEAYRQIGVSIASLGYYCGPIIVMAISPFLFKEKLTKHKLFFFSLVFAGIILVNCNAFTEFHNTAGIICSLMSAVMYACMLCLNKKAKGITGIENATLQLCFSFVSVFVFVLVKQGLHISIQNSDVVPLIFLGLINTGVGCFLYFSSIGNIKVQSVAILGYMEPLFAVLFSFLFLKERLLPIQIAGAVLIITGAVCANLHAKSQNA